MSMSFDPIENIIEDIRLGKMVIIVDDEDRENEGDLIMAAEKVTPAHINFMAQQARGLICMPISKQKAEQLNLPLMVRNNQSVFTTNFTTSIEAATGVTTGISAADRARTIQVAANRTAQAEDIVQPGHIFPIVAMPGGVLVRAGHTEASVDLARLAGCSEAGVLVEIMNPDGSMARRDDLIEFAKIHDLKISSIADLIRYRLKMETTVEPIYETTLSLFDRPFRVIAFQDKIHPVTHLAFVHGKIVADKPMPVRVQTRMNLMDLPGVCLESNAWTMSAALQYILHRQGGALLMLDQPSGHEDLASQVKHLVGEHAQASAPSWRQIGVGSQILSQLGFQKLEVLGSHKKMHALSGFGLNISRYVEASTEQQSEECCHEAV